MRRDEGGRRDRDKERERGGEQAAQPSVHAPLPARLASECAPALLQELALEPVQSRLLAGIVGPLERGREAGAAVELARVAATRPPLLRCLGQMSVHAPPQRVLVEPRDEPRPALEESLVDELDRIVVDDEEATRDEGRDHTCDVLVVVGVELLMPDAPACRYLPVCGR